MRPLGREGYVTIPVFFFGWPTGEAAPVVAGASVLDAVRRGLRGDFTGRRGRIALALTAISWGVLAFVYRRNAKSQPHFEDPLREALGEDYAAVADAPSDAAAAAECSARRGRAASTSKKADIIRYGPHAGQRGRHLAPRRPAHATARRRCCFRCRAARGRSACAGRRPIR